VFKIAILLFVGIESNPIQICTKIPTFVTIKALYKYDFQS